MPERSTAAVCRLTFSGPFAGWHVSRASTTLDAAVSQAGDDFPLDDDGEKQYRDGHDERRGGQRAPRQLLEGQDVVDRRRQRPGRAAGEHRAEDEVVPGKNEGEYGSDDYAWSRQRQRDITEHRPDVGAVDLCRFFELARKRLEVSGHDVDGDRDRDDQVRDQIG